MAIVSNAIVLSFHLKLQPSELELRMARPLGIVFWVLSMCCLGLGVGNYISMFGRGLSRFTLSNPTPSSLTMELCARDPRCTDVTRSYDKQV